MRRFAAVLLFLLALAAPAALAQTAAPRPAPAPAITPQQAQQALEVLRDPARRAQYIAVLETLARVAPTVAAGGAARPAAPSPAPAPAPPPGPTGPGSADAPAPTVSDVVPLAPDSVGAQVIEGASERLGSLTDELIDTFHAITNFPLIALWLAQLARDPATQMLMLEAAWRLALVLVTGLLAERVVTRALRPLRARLADRAPAPPPPVEDVAEPAAAAAGAEARQWARLWRRTARFAGWMRRLPLALGALALDMLPLAAVLAAGYAVLASAFGAAPIGRLLIVAALNAYVLYRAVLGVVRLLVAPEEARLRLLPVSDALAAYVWRWARRAAAVGIFGHAIVEAGLLFGLYRLAHDALLTLIQLVLHLFVAVIILQNRAAVAALIAPRSEAKGLAAAVRARIAPVWHLVAVAYVMALWLVVALDVPDGFVRLLRLFGFSAAILVGAHFALILVMGTVQRLLLAVGATAESEERRPGYDPMLRAVARMAIGTATALGLLEVWGVPATAWFSSSQLGTRVLSTLGTIGFTLLLAIAVWEVVNAAVDRHLAGLAAGGQAARSARLRTLMPMLRTALLVLICLVAGLTVLSEIGLNIAPLLAGAGVLGVAIGFGSQRLVQDVITGLFLLLENTMQVGDVVTLGGLTGTVENLSIRTIRLRALDGSMHIVPFSAVSSVTNMTRDFGYAVVDVSVGLNENTDAVGEVLREIAAEMRKEPQWAPGISADLEVMGVDRFIENAVVLRTRIRTTPGQRWAVGRELNRRIKQRFDERAIESPMTSYRVLQHQVLDEASG